MMIEHNLKRIAYYTWPRMHDELDDRRRNVVLMKSKSKIRETRKGRIDKTANDTHIVFDLLVGASIDQQPRTVCATIPSGTNQRRPSDL